MQFRAILLLYMITRAVCGDLPNSSKIVIVGAGASGIAAASKLLQNGFNNILLLEAEDRVGGRVHTVKFDDYMVDMGAQWIDGEVGNVVYEMVAPLNITDHSDPSPFVEYYTPSGEMIDSTLVDNITDFYMQLSAEEIPPNNCTRSQGECLEKELKQYFTNFPELNETMQEKLLWFFNQVDTSYESADSWYNVSVNSYAEFIKSEGDAAINWKNRGYGTILDILMKKFPNPDEELPVLNKTILGDEVTKVDYSSKDGVVKLTTLDGKEYTADHVIMTPSLGVLKEQHETLFNPPLPASKVKNIKNLGFGNACKIFLAFNDTWFNNGGLKNGGFSILWSEEERRELESDPKRMWLPHALSFFFVEHKPHLLALWISGKGARLMDDLTDDEVFDQTVQLLNNTLSEHYNVSRPTAMIRSKWHQNKHFRGTWSYISTDAKNTNSSAKQLSEPIMIAEKPLILFAGEATNSGYYSTVHGAIGAGWREADRIIDFYRKKAKAADNGAFLLLLLLLLL